MIHCFLDLFSPPYLEGHVMNWSTDIGDHEVEYESRVGTPELNQVLREFQKCGTIVERVVGPDGANWVQIQYQVNSPYPQLV